MSEQALQLWPCEIAAMDPPDIMSVSEWANTNIVLLPESSPRQPGPYRWQRTPYAKAVMDLYKHPDIRHIVLKWGTQLGKTQTIYNILGYIIDQDPYSTLLVYPSEDESKKISRVRVQPMIAASPALAAKIPEDPRQYQLLEMHFPGMVLYLGSGAGAASLAQIPVRNLIRDEVNKYPPAIGEHGDPMRLSEQRCKANWDIRKVLDVSSPTGENGNITQQEAACQVVMKYYVPCPHCLTLQSLEWKRIKFDNRKDLDKVSRIAHAKATARYECLYCGASIGDEHKPWMLDPDHGAGWFDMRRVQPLPSPDPIADVFDAFAAQGVRLESVAFRLWSAYSPWLTWGDCVEEFLAAHLAKVDRFDKLRSYTNDWLGQEWEDEAADQKTEAEVLRLCCELPPLVLPPAAIAVTAGVDMQKRGFFYTVWAWARDMSSWLIQYGYLMTFENVEQLIYDSTYRPREGGRPLGIWRGGLDTGGTDDGQDGSMTDAAYTWLARRGGNTVYGIKGASRETSEKIKGTIIGTYPGTHKPIPSAGVKLFVVDTGYFKDVFHNHLQVKAGDPGAVYLHADTGMDYAEQITSEVKRRNRRGLMTWTHVRGQNHYLDATIYARLLVHPMCLGGLALVRDQAPQDPRPGRKGESKDGDRPHAPAPASGRGERW